MDNTVNDVMISCKTRIRQNFAKAFAGSAKPHVTSNDIRMKSVS
ncbi:protein of unknown function [Nitrosotalea devaniterrae]|uniref:Uncharacterized protein n=1 Tax=Nitrosotalea devaniterrae TaxID=1078905 RepID=A0A128A4L1_9ARCH|nr:protein of unknown function [Candidatus Nitrosotalea devanaterra]